MFHTVFTFMTLIAGNVTRTLPPTLAEVQWLRVVKHTFFFSLINV